MTDGLTGGQMDAENHGWIDGWMGAQMMPE